MKSDESGINLREPTIANSRGNPMAALRALNQYPSIRRIDAEE